MTINKTVVDTGHERKITVSPELNGNFVTLLVRDTYEDTDILSSVPNNKARELGKALFEAAGSTFVGPTEVPEAEHRNGWVVSGEFSYSDSIDPEVVQNKINDLRAVRNKLKEVQKERSDLTSRRNKTAAELSGDSLRTYDNCTLILRKAIDRIIALEDAK
ncbi:Hypothetical Protein OBI_RACECAR_239 [Arthrobacter phage Racecar]|nr:hypothetical protein PBI_RACECAR_31 [Arthrobacter phage Racecar]QFG12715.1 hypothetical protein PBI_MIMI_31 [Arthrobacter phage Mimi]